MKNTPPLKHLSNEAAEIWRHLVDEYGISDPGGLQLLKLYCECFDRATACRKQIDTEGMQVSDRFGQMKPHPLLAAERDARSQMLASLRQLNLDVEPLRDAPGRPPGGRGR